MSIPDGLEYMLRQTDIRIDDNEEMTVWSKWTDIQARLHEFFDEEDTAGSEP